MRRLITYLVLSVLTLLLAAPATAATSEVRSLRSGIQWQRSTTWHWQDRAGVARTPTKHVERRTTSVAFLRWVDRLWMHRRIAASKLAARQVAHLSLWLCIHGTKNPYGHYEARNWHNQDTGGNGHYGGLQMSLNWGWNQYVHYGLPGNPANYSEAQQLAAAERGYRANGYSQSWLLGQWNHPECLQYA